MARPAATIAGHVGKGHWSIAAKVEAAHAIEADEVVGALSTDANAGLASAAAAELGDVAFILWRKVGARLSLADYATQTDYRVAKSSVS